MGRKEAAVNPWSLRPEYSRVNQESLFVSVLMNGSETMEKRGKGRYGIEAVQTHNLKGLLGMRRKNRILNALVKALCKIN